MRHELAKKCSKRSLMISLAYKMEFLHSEALKTLCKFKPVIKKLPRKVHVEMTVVVFIDLNTKPQPNVTSCYMLNCWTNILMQNKYVSNSQNTFFSHNQII